jgi:hypothetical protein
MAGIISQKTNLKSLRYGRDRVGGGDSNQPYVKSDIPDKSSSLDRSGGFDFLLRGGILAPSRAAKDVSRLTKMFFDFKSPNGPLFIAKQNLLSRTGVKTQASGFLLSEGAYLPTSTILQAGGNAFGTHLLKQGINPARNTSPNAGAVNNRLLNLLGIADTVQSIIQDVGGLPVYAHTVRSNQSADDNRLVQLKDSKIGSNTDTTQQGAFGDSNFRNILREINPFKKGQSLKNIAKTIFSNKTKKLGISNNNGEILRYGGGPGSILGVGQTSIKRYVYSTTQGFSNDVSKGFFNVLGAGQGIQSRRIGNSGGNTVSDFRALLPKDPNTTRQNILSISPDYKIKNIESRVNLGDPGKKTKNLTSYTNGLGALDKITAFPLYRSDKGNHGGYRNDLVKFSIGIIDNDSPDQRTYIHFRAFLDSMDDQYNAEWNGFKYMGRGENFYRYNGFARTINLSWTVTAQSKEELIPMYHKLNFLASSLAPNYSKQGYMRGNLAVLTVGGYVFEQPGIINSINYGVPQESPWEIGINDVGGFDNSVKELPHMIKVTGFNFTPIHTFTPALQDNQYSDITPDKRGILSNTVSGFGDQRYIALTNGDNTNYRTPEYIVEKPARPKLDTSLGASDLSLGSTLDNIKKQGIIRPTYSQTDKNKAINDIKLATQTPTFRP